MAKTHHSPIHLPIPDEVDDTASSVFHYHAGQSNIGNFSINQHKQAIRFFLPISIVYGLAIVASQAPWWLFSIWFIPSVIVTACYLEIRQNFCAYYGALGLINLGDDSQLEKVSRKTDKAKDRSLAAWLVLKSGIIALLATGLLFALSRVL